MILKQTLAILILIMLIAPAAAGLNETVGAKKVISLEDAKVDDGDVAQKEDVKKEVIKDEPESEYSSIDLLASGFVEGFDLIIISFADAISSIWKNNIAVQKLGENEAVIEEYGLLRGGIFTLVSANIQPDEIEAIAEFEKNTKAEWVFLVCVYILGFVMFANIERAKRGIFASTLSKHDLSDSRFVGGAVLCMASFLAPRLILVALDVCTGVSQFFMINVMDYIEPSVDNAYMYLFMTIGESLIAIFFIIRQWAIDIVYVFSRFLVIIYIMGFFQDELLWVYSKFKKILALQPVCVGVACICLVAIKSANMEDATGAYILMFLFIAYILKEWMFGGVLDKSVRRAVGVWVAKV